MTCSKRAIKKVNEAMRKKYDEYEPASGVVVGLVFVSLFVGALAWVRRFLPQ